MILHMLCADTYHVGVVHQIAVHSLKVNIRIPLLTFRHQKIQELYSRFF
jgi:hypothetical protein